MRYLDTSTSPQNRRSLAAAAVRPRRLDLAELPQVSPASVTFTDALGRSLHRLSIESHANGVLRASCSCEGYAEHACCVHIWTTTLILSLLRNRNLRFRSLRIRWSGLDEMTSQLRGGRLS